MDDFLTLSRRDFLAAAGTLGALAGFTLFTGGCESFIHKIRNRPTRRNIAHLPPNDPIVQTYRDAVTAMKALPAADPRSWEKQANIHFDHCPHGNWYFLPWHRAYLYYFERICRKLTGNHSFALPYWNWSTSPSIPGVFWGAGNPLFDANRAATAASMASAAFVGPSVLENILNEPNFFVFASGQAVGQRTFSTYGMLEGTPHNYVHGFVGGDMGAFHSPRDPVFWTHHNMVDCMWVEWNINRRHPNTNDPAWTNFTFTDFADENGNSVTVNAITTVLYPYFSYQFEPCHPAEARPGAILEQATLEKFLREGAAVKLEFERRFEIRRSVTAIVGRPATAAIPVEPGVLRSVLEAGPKTSAILTVAGAELPSQSDFFVRVFLNKPDATQQTPIDDPHYAGSFAIFFDAKAMREEGRHGKPGYVVDITPTIRRLAGAGALTSDNQVAVSLVPVPFEGREVAGKQITIERLELGVAHF
jgi:tyrosinase